jgi:hypothetical protein
MDWSVCSNLSLLLLLAFGNPHSASDEQRSSTQPARFGSAVNPAKMNDEKRRLSTHDCFGKAQYRPVGQPDASAFSSGKSRPADVERAPEKLSLRPDPLGDETQLKTPQRPHIPKSVLA